MAVYTKDQSGQFCIRSSDNAFVPWDNALDQPLDICGLVGRAWVDDGSPRSLPYVVPTPTVPDGPTLGDWRVALELWGKLDQVETAVAALKSDSDPKRQLLGKIADQRIAYSNNVLRKDLLLFSTSVGFSEADVDESLWRAGQVAKGDLSGTWPLPAN